MTQVERAGAAAAQLNASTTSCFVTPRGNRRVVCTEEEYASVFWFQSQGGALSSGATRADATLAPGARGGEGDLPLRQRPRLTRAQFVERYGGSEEEPPEEWALSEARSGRWGR